ncbi:hypothetical protein [Lactiplantibacillus paraplantarum]|uniref:hypothetical protein n=1 Tax=Lactiplantibacillus paraplantarum TaxID=60520 RepID=UPI0023AAB625|nr:hypothetical protein [Lactiplantibacillus paraplantarum]WEE34904.1 hypothetical protein PWO93_09205 [Lactiplantibacillus paraplantarum]
MTIIKNVLISYAHGLVLFILVFYLMTANPNGTMTLHWYLLNTIWLVSYLVAFPALRLVAPKFSRVHIHMTSMTTKALNFDDARKDSTSKLYHESISPVMNQLDIKGHSKNRDDGISLAVDMLLSGVFIAISIPALLVIMVKKATE